MNWLVAAILLCNVLIIAALAVLFASGWRIVGAIRAFFTPGRDNSPSPAAYIYSILCERAATAIITKAQVTIGGIKSAQVRNAKKAIGEAASDVIATSPMLSVIMSLIPKEWQGALRRNPALAELALSKIKNNATVPGSNSDTMELTFNQEE